MQGLRGISHRDIFAHLKMELGFAPLQRRFLRRLVSGPSRSISRRGGTRFEATFGRDLFTKSAEGVPLYQDNLEKWFGGGYLNG